jgi:leucyl-tRNA synthetase
VIQPEGRTLDGRRSGRLRGPGTVVNSGPFDGLASTRRIARWRAWAETKGFGKATITYRLKDWLISRQRYWGTPIPVVYCDKTACSRARSRICRSCSGGRAVHGRGR